MATNGRVRQSENQVYIRAKPSPPTQIDKHQRYSIPESAAILRQSVPQLYLDIAAGKLRRFKVGARTYISGKELIRASAPPMP